MTQKRMYGWIYFISGLVMLVFGAGKLLLELIWLLVGAGLLLNGLSMITRRPVSQYASQAFFFFNNRR